MSQVDKEACTLSRRFLCLPSYRKVDASFKRSSTLVILSSKSRGKRLRELLHRFLRGLRAERGLRPARLRLRLAFLRGVTRAKEPAREARFRHRRKGRGGGPRLLAHRVKLGSGLVRGFHHVVYDSVAAGKRLHVPHHHQMVFPARGQKAAGSIEGARGHTRCVAVKRIQQATFADIPQLKTKVCSRQQIAPARCEYDRADIPSWYHRVHRTRGSCRRGGSQGPWPRSGWRGPPASWKTREGRARQAGRTSARWSQAPASNSTVTSPRHAQDSAAPASASGYQTF
eukprot:scaffold1806_cov240-Pinguiococcus_pyrenoidosus.AAC.39